VVAGLNPFHTRFDAQTIGGLPLDHFPMAMSYGPLWALLSALIVVVAANNIVAIGLLFKLVLAAAWMSALLLVDRFHRDQPARERCVAMALLGWVPLGVSQSVAEGHNDIAMIALALLWFVLLLRGSTAAPLALAASVLCKYATAPLVLVDLVCALRVQRLTMLQYARRVLPAALLSLLLLALFVRSSAFFDGIRMVSEWYFLRPSDAVSGLEQITGLRLFPLPIVAQAALPVIAAVLLAVAVRSGTTEGLTKAAVAIMAAILFGATSHLWPWYLVWGVAFAALLPQWWISRYITGVALLIPFTLPTWWIAAIEPHRDVATLAVYAGAGLWILLTRGPPPDKP
jgi:alpha-1,6-mannosyltransferase